MIICKWGEFEFGVKAKLIRGARDIELSTTAEVEEQTNGGEKYVTFKAGQHEVTMTALLNRSLGDNVQAAALKMHEAAFRGEKNYFYMGGEKLLPCMLMLTGAKTSSIEITPGALWRSCEVALTFRQCTKLDGTAPPGESSSSGGGGGGGGGSRRSARATQPTTTPARTPAEVAAGVTAVAAGVRAAIQSSQSSRAAAEQQSSSMYGTRTGQSTGGMSAGTRYNQTR